MSSVRELRAASLVPAACRMTVHGWLIVAMSGAVAAQTARIEQIPSAPPPRETLIAAPDARSTPQVSTGDSHEPPAQVSLPGDTRGPITQLNRERRSTPATAQVAPRERNAQPVAPLSSRLESKPGGVVRVGGRDRCDPARSRRSADCARVIETRSAEFATSNPMTLSAEQRLLIDQRLRDVPATPEGAVQRIGRNEVDATAADAQSIASVVLPSLGSTPEKSPTDPTGGASALGDAEILNVIQALAGGTPAATSPPR